MAKRKMEGTPHFVRGLLVATDRILPPGRGRRGPTDHKSPVDTSPVGLRRLGIYQGRVVLAALAAELALKFLFERRDGREAARNTHDLHKLFGRLTEHDQLAVESVYREWLNGYVPTLRWCDTAGGVFKQCRGVFEQWRYITEGERLSESFEMKVTYLSAATRSVLEVADSPPSLPTEP